MRTSRGTRRFALLAAAAVLATGMGAGSAAASSSAGTDTTTGGTTTTKYRVAYVDLIFFGAMECKGVHQTGKNFPGDATSGGRDVFTCTSTSGDPLPNVSPDQSLTLDDIPGWYSDYFSSVYGTSVPATDFSGTVSSDGYSFSATAEYF